MGSVSRSYCGSWWWGYWGGLRVDIGGVHIPSILSAGGTFASIYTAFSRFDENQTEASRSFVSAWLKGLKAPQANWSMFFLDIFEKFFGAKQLSLKCARRSLLLSAFLMIGLYTLIVVSSDAHFETYMIEDVLPLIFAACVTDYLSLWKTRALLTRFDIVRKRITVIGLLAVDFVGTTIIYMLCWFSTMQLVNRLESGSWDTAFDSLVWQFFYALGTGQLSKEDLWFYWPALLTSAWLWMYVIVSQSLRILSFVPAFVSGLSKVADLDEHPVRTIGFLAACVSSVIVGIFVLF
jgi:hypothetical protein